MPIEYESTMLTIHAGHKYLRPKSIHDSDVVEEYSRDYMYLACIKFINSVRILVHITEISLLLNVEPDQDSFPAMAFANAGRYLWGTHIIDASGYRRADAIFFVGEILGESQSRYAEDVPRRSSRKAPCHATLPFRINPALRRSSPSLPPGRRGRRKRCTLGSCAYTF